MYWPEDDEAIFGDIKVRLATTQKQADYIIRTLHLMKVGLVVFIVTKICVEKNFPKLVITFFFSEIESHEEVRKFLVNE